MSKKLSKYLGVFIALAALSGCGDETTSHSTDAQTSNQQVSDTLDKNLIVISDNGVGPINTQMPFNMHQVTIAFPNYSVVEQLTFQEGESYPIISVSKGANTLMTINPTSDLKSIYSIIVEDNLISNSLNHRLGTLFSDIYTQGKNSFTCQPGAEEMSGKVLCMAPSSSNMLYLFTGKWDGPDAELPPPNTLLGWALEAIIWKPS